jgi:hypothetical protein
MIPTPARERIRSRIVLPYSPVEAAEAIGMSVEDVRGWMAVGELEGIEFRGAIVLPWEELVSFAMDFWEPADIEAALGAEVAEALPELLRLADLEVASRGWRSWRCRNWRRGMGSWSIRCWRGS